MNRKTKLDCHGLFGYLGQLVFSLFFCTTPRTSLQKLCASWRQGKSFQRKDFTALASLMPHSHSSSTFWISLFRNPSKVPRSQKAVSPVRNSKYILKQIIQSILYKGQDLILAPPFINCIPLGKLNSLSFNLLVYQMVSTISQACCKD